jgi:predicted 2-oxoglutarate/Fe(II)-dependent dioxygenase YbiX
MTAGARVYVNARFLDAGACRRIRAAMDGGMPEPAGVLGAREALQPTVRRVWDIEVDPDTLADAEARLDAEREAIAAFHACRLGGREGVGFLRYRSGDFYRRHLDRGAVASWPAAARRLISVVVFLSSAGSTRAEGDFTGGSLRLFDRARDPFDIVPREGCLIAFPSTVPHEVTPVQSGTRDTLVDWFYDG